MTQSVFEILYKGTDQLSGAANQAARSQDRLARSSAKLNKEVIKGKTSTTDAAASMHSFQSAMVAGGILVGIQQVARLAVEMQDLGAHVIAAEFTLNELTGGAAPEFIDAVTQALDGTIDNLTATQVANKAVALGFAETEEEVAAFARSAVILGQAFQGLSADQSVNQFSLLLANTSFRRLDTFGLSISEVKSRMSELQEQTAGLTREQAFNNAVIEIAGQKSEMFAGALEGPIGDGARLSATLKNIGQDVSEFFTPALSEAAFSLNILLTAYGEITQAAEDNASAMQESGRLVNLTKEEYKAFSPAIRDGIRALAEEQIMLETGTSARSAHGIAVNFASQNFEEFTAVLDRSTLRLQQEEQALRFVEQATMDAEKAALDHLNSTEGFNESVREKVNQLRAEEAAQQRANDVEQAAEDIINAHEIAEERLKETLKEREKAQKAALSAAKESLSLQKSITSAIGDLVIQNDALGSSFTTMVGDSGIVGFYEEMAARLAEIGPEMDAVTLAMEFQGDGEGALQAKLDSLIHEYAFLSDAMAKVVDSGRITTETFKTLGISQERLADIGTAYIDSLEAQGAIMGLAGDELNNLRLAYGLVTEEQLLVEDGTRLITQAVKDGILTFAEGSEVFNALFAGQLDDIDAVKGAIDGIADTLGNFGKAGELAAMGLLPPEDIAAIETLGGVDLLPVTEGLKTVTDQLVAEQDAINSIRDNSPLAYAALMEGAPIAAEAVAPLSRFLVDAASALLTIGSAAETTFEALTIAAGDAAAEGGGLAQAASLLQGIHEAWLFLFLHPVLSVTLFVEVIGGSGIPASGGGGNFVTRGPQLMLVGDNPSGREKVTVEPLGAKGQTRMNGAKNLIKMAGGGSVTTTGSGGGMGGNVIHINVGGITIQSSGSETLDAQKILKALEREARLSGRTLFA